MLFILYSLQDFKRSAESRPVARPLRGHNAVETQETQETQETPQTLETLEPDQRDKLVTPLIWKLISVRHRGPTQPHKRAT